MIFGQRVQQLRRERNLSQEQLAEKAGLHVNMVALVERAQKRATITTIVKLAVALDVLPEELLAPFDQSAMRRVRRALGL